MYTEAIVHENVYVYLAGGWEVARVLQKEVHFGGVMYLVRVLHTGDEIWVSAHEVADMDNPRIAEVSV